MAADMAAPQPRAEAGGRRVRIAPPGGTSPRGPGPVDGNDPSAGLRQLLAVEAAFRHAPDRDALGLAIVNESVTLVRARQGFLLRTDRLGGLAVERVSGTIQVERNAPLLAVVEAAVTAIPKAERAASGSIDLSASEGEEARTYPFRHGLWVPLLDRSRAPVGGLLLTRERAFDEADTALAGRLAETGAHALLALRPPRLPRLSGDLRKPALVVAGLVLAGLACPVSMTVLAPATITAERPFVVAAPIEGIIEEIAPAPNAAVAVGDLVLRYVDTAQRNALSVSEREVQVADAKLRQVTLGAYAEERVRREIGQARAELALKVAERDFARDTFAKTQVRAERAGVAVYADRKDWYGKPVAAGQRILEIADPKTVDIRIDLPVSDAIALAVGSRVRVFLDADPLNALDAQVDQVTPVARMTEAGVLAHRIVAKLPAAASVPRLGARGTAQLYGSTVPFGFTLLRKPLAVLRQKVGL
ncbi:HlyD family efflux transporter periplasmic adaptor subunit [Methylobacterium terricola]|uniref:HlyD family efflux transporter periplasmic adaptor subunit n=1 Tax=Methylobacterium terricola TaxID=2583531 RepID=A0A5C4LB54_9HYPH|nr:HlyD family secretion protein [Methylobacterium terricola]TNC08378.1 HlyD family efflux transporter periplasmic adaptor subunit [Methylobacterium terricola]